MAKICLPKGSGKRLKVSEKSGNFEMDIEWQPCILSSEYVIHWKQKSLGKEVGVTWKSYWCG